MTEKYELAPFIESAENDGVVDERALASVTAELELEDDEVAALRSELEARGVEIVAAAIDGEGETDDELELSLEPPCRPTR